MDHYERLEQIDYKSARDVVTEADHLSEAMIVEAIRTATRATRSWPRRPASIGPSPERRRPPGGAASGSSTRSTGPSTTPTASPSSASRSGSLIDGQPARRRDRGPHPARVVRGHARWPGHARRSADRHVRKGQALRLRDLDGACPGAPPRSGPGTSASRSGSRGPWVRRRSRWPTWPTAGSMPSSSRAGCPPGTLPRPASSPNAAGRGSPRWMAARGSTWPAGPVDRDPRGAAGPPRGAARAGRGAALRG